MKYSNPKKIQIQDYNYHLPEEKIAKYPVEERDTSKLLVYKNEAITDSLFNSCIKFLPKESTIIFNNTRVIQARLIFNKISGAKIELFCLEPSEPNDYIDSFQSTDSCKWLCLIGNAKKWKEGELELKLLIEEKETIVKASKIRQVGESTEIQFTWDNESLTFAEILHYCGQLPIPPYLDRNTEEADLETYQTVYSKIDGSVAAPTAGLHFTDRVLSDLKFNHHQTLAITLHVGAGTFKPVKSEDIGDHQMHSELISVKRTVIEQILEDKKKGKKLIAVGTTSVRTLESLYYIGILLEDKNTSIENLNVNQWMPYEYDHKLSIEQALSNIIYYLSKHNQDTLIAHTSIMIVPGFIFKIIDGMFTNFHQPKSTLLLLIAALVGEDQWRKIYAHALENDYRFLSYGDSSLLLRQN